MKGLMLLNKLPHEHIPLEETGQKADPAQHS
jgi:hypothetical protein